MFLRLGVTLYAWVWLCFVYLLAHKYPSRQEKKTVCVRMCVCVCVSALIRTHFPTLFSMEISFHMGQEPRRARGLPWHEAKGVVNVLTIISWVPKWKEWEGGRRKHGGGGKLVASVKDFDLWKQTESLTFLQYFKLYTDMSGLACSAVMPLKTARAWGSIEGQINFTHPGEITEKRLSLLSFGIFNLCHPDK